MLNANMQRVQNVRDLLVLLAEDDHFRQDVQQNPKIMLAYLAALGDNTLKKPQFGKATSHIPPSCANRRRQAGLCSISLKRP